MMAIPTFDSDSRFKKKTLGKVSSVTKVMMAILT